MSVFKLSKKSNNKLDKMLTELTTKFTKQELSVVNVSNIYTACNCGGGCKGSCTGRCGGCGGNSCKGGLSLF